MTMSQGRGPGGVQFRVFYDYPSTSALVNMLLSKRASTPPHDSCYVFRILLLKRKKENTHGKTALKA